MLVLGTNVGEYVVIDDSYKPAFQAGFAFYTSIRSQFSGKNFALFEQGFHRLDPQPAQQFDHIGIVDRGWESRFLSIVCNVFPPLFGWDSLVSLGACEYKE